MYDYHLHSTYSQDGHLTINEICEIQIKNGFKEIAITDHVDYNFAGNRDFVLDYENYSKDIARAKETYRGVLKIIKGVEIGLQPDTIQQNINFVTNHQFDFVIGSVHFVDGSNLFNGDFCHNRKREDAYREYLQFLEDAIKDFPYFNVLGHLDGVRRYPEFEDRLISTEEFPELIDRILVQLINTRRGIEVNSSGFRFQVDDTLPSLNIVKRFRELGGEIITAGSDAHKENACGANISEAFRTIKAGGFDYLCLFRDGKPIKVHLPGF
ncbi:MAG: histidinol-phosphatase HisJ family protein [Dehalobacterium sp.]